MNRTFAFLLLSVCISANAATLYVAQDGSHQPPFSTWNTAATNLNAAVAAAANGDTIEITNGHYLTRSLVNGKDLVLRGQGQGTTWLDGNSNSAILTVLGPAEVRVDGLSFVSGVASNGGGMACYNANVTVTNCLYTRNYSAQGGGIYASNCTLTVYDSHFNDNYGALGGAGIHAFGSIVLLRGVLAEKGQADFRGGGVEAFDTVLEAENCKFYQNRTASLAGALYGEDSHFTLTRCDFFENLTIGLAAVASVSGGTFQATNCRIERNQQRSGGLIHCTRVQPRLVNCRITRNRGLAIYVLGNGGVAYVTHCTLNANSAGGIVNDPFGVASFRIRNSIVWGNGPDAENCEATYSCIGSGASGMGVFTNNPLLTIVGDLTAQSPCINAGNTGLGITNDLAGEQRDALPDVGADEFVDSDSDELPDRWELEWGFATNSPDASEALADNDHDLFTNLDEYRWVTGPRDPWSPECYVGPVNTNDFADGSQAAPFPTIGAAVQDKAKAIVHVLPGIYHESVVLLGGEYSLRGPDVMIDPGGKGAAIDAYAVRELDLCGLTLEHGADTDVSFGGGLRAEGSRVYMANCVARDNVAADAGGGIYLRGSHAMIEQCTIAGNVADGSDGGGIAAVRCTGRISDCTILSNEAAYGGGIYVTLGDLQIRNCSIAANEVRLDGGGVYFGGNLPPLRNSIVWHNRALVGNNDDVAGAAVEFCCIDNYALHSGNITNDPLLTPSLHLTHLSACRNNGTNLPNQTLDIDGEPRPLEARNDIGSDEWLDSDGDFLPDWWELLWQFPTNRPNGNDDPDLDGIPNVDEYRYETLPLNTNELSFAGATNLVTRAMRTLTNRVVVITSTNELQYFTCTTERAPGSSFVVQAATGTLYWTALPTQVGVWSNIAFIVADTRTSVTNAIWIKVLQTNRAPQLVPVPDVVVGEGQALQVPVMSIDPDEGDYVTLAVSNQLLPGSSLTMTTSGTGTFDWVPWYDAAGTYDDVLLIARDRDGFRDTDAFRITVTNVFVPPQATGVSINDGMQFTNTAAVVLSLSASNAVRMAIANDESGLTNWVPYTLTRTWTLAGVEGTNDVYVRYRTPWGDESTNVHDAIVLDLTPPACAGVFPPDGWITNGLPELVWQGSDAPGGAGLAGFELETNSFGTLLATNHFTFEVESQGSNTWRVRATDGAGNTGPWTAPRWFFFDSAPPMKTHVKFVDGRGNGWTAQTNVLLSLKAFDASPIQVRLGTSADLGGAAWQPYATTVNWQLVEGEGMNHIYAEFRDSAMQAAPVVSDTIGLDMTAPSLEVLWPTQTWTWTNAALALNWSANDTVGGLSGTWVVVNGLAAFRPGATYTPAWLAEQTNSWRMQAVDLAGNTSAWTSVSYVGFDTNAPVLAQDLILAPQSDATWLQGSWEEVRWQSTGITDWILADAPVALNLLLWPDLAFTNLSISVSNSGSALVQAPLFDTDQFCLVSLRVTDRCGNSAQALSEAFDLLVPEPGGLLLLAGIAAWRARARRQATSTR